MMTMSKALEIPDKTCTIRKLEHDMWRGEFSPGLPYDPMTKGCKHNAADIEIIEIQSPTTHQANVYLSIHEVGKHGLRYMHYLFHLMGTRDTALTAKRLTSLLKTHLGYTVIDHDKKVALNALKKLTEEEIRALRISGV
jgi:hypothetical protein